MDRDSKITQRLLVVARLAQSVNDYRIGKATGTILNCVARPRIQQGFRTAEIEPSDDFDDHSLYLPWSGRKRARSSAERLGGTSILQKAVECVNPPALNDRCREPLANKGLCGRDHSPCLFDAH